MTSQRNWTGRVFIGVSLDGFIARPDGDISWLTDPPQGRDHTPVESSQHALTWETFFPDIDTLVMGRGTYETVAGFPEWPFEGKRVVVLSTTLPGDDGRVTVVRSLEEVIRALNDAGAQQVYVDGGKVIQSFLREGLVDEITLSWMPVLIGAGRSLFGELAQDVHLTLRATHASDDGMVCATYSVG